MEAEGMILISMLVEKTGLNNLILKDKIIEILKTIVSTGDLFPIQSSSLLVLKGLISKNKWTHCEILPVIDYIIDIH